MKEFYVLKNEHASFWFKKDTNLFDRDNGPAVEYSVGIKHYYKNGVLHRTDGPAIEHNDGYSVWFLNGIQYSYLDFLKMKDIID
jgi:hypothetical protein